MDLELRRIDRMPPYVFAAVNDLKMQARRAGEDVIDLGMGNPDLPTPQRVVDKLTEAAQKPVNHRYSASRGITKLRGGVCDWYERHFDVGLDPEKEALVTIGVKEGMTHLAWVLLRSGDVCFVPEPTYPIHMYAPILTGAEVITIKLGTDTDFFKELLSAYHNTWPRPRVLICSFPHNPTTNCVDLEFMERLVHFAREKDLFIVHDFAYSQIVFDGYRPPSILQVPGAKDVAVEFLSISKSHSMAGWRLGFAVGNPQVVGGLQKLKSYLDYGVFQPIQIAGIIALNECDDEAPRVSAIYQKRRDVLCEGLARAGWQIDKPKATMFVWAPIPEAFAHMGSLEFSLHMLRAAKVAVSPGVGFGRHGDGHVRFALVENEERTRQAVRGIKKMLDAGPPEPGASADVS